VAVGYHGKQYHAQPTTLASQDAGSQVNDINTGTANPRGNVHGATDRLLQRGAEDNQAQTTQAVGGFMSGRGAKLIEDGVNRALQADVREKKKTAISNIRGAAKY